MATPARHTGIARFVMPSIMGFVLLMGGSAFVSGLRLVLAGDPNRAGAIAATLMGLALTGLAAAYFYWAFLVAPIEAARSERARRLYPGQPWMKRADWASRVLKSSSRGPMIFLWIWCIGWWFFLGVIGTVNRDKIMVALAQSWWNWALAALFGGAGILGLWAALAFTYKTLRYGTSSLRLDTLPAFMGDRFVGTMSARLKPMPREPLAIELACEQVEWITSGYGEKRETKLVVRPQGGVTTQLAASRLMPSKDGVTGRIEIDVPTTLPASSRDEEGNGIKWWVRISTTGKDAPFSCEFEIPVYERPR